MMEIIRRILAVSIVLWMTTVVMIAAALRRCDPALVGASAYSFIAASTFLAFAVLVFKASKELDKTDGKD